MTSIAGWFNFEAFTDAGDPLIAGRLYTYAFGTTTFKTAYTDAAGSVPQTYTSDGLGGQYIALNARGELPAPLYLAAGSYDMALKRADGSTVWTRRADPIGDVAASLDAALRSDLASADTTKGTKLIRFLTKLAGGVARWLQDKLSETVSVKDFGAVGDGVVNDTIAIQAAHNASAKVYYPAGTYLVSGNIAVNDGASIQGDSGGRSIIKLSADLPGDLDAIFNVLIANISIQQAGLIVRDVYINGDGHFAHGVRMQSLRFPEFENVTIQNCNGAGLLIDYAEEGTFRGMKINACGRTNGSPNESTATLYGQVTFLNTAGGISSNFIRIVDSTVANGRCSGDFMIKSGNVSRIYLERIQSETGNAAIGLRDWFLGQGLGGIVWITECDAVNYRVALKDFQFIEAYVNDNRITNCDKFLVANDGTGTFTASGNTTDGSMEVTSISSLTLVGNRALGSLFLEFPNNVRISSNSSIEALIVNNAGALRAVCINDNTITGDMRIGADAACPGASVFDNRIAGAAYYGPFVHAVNNLVTGGETITPDARVQALRGAAMTGSITYGTAAPTTGTWQRGSKVINTAPAAAGYEAFICTATGTPGTWKGVGLIQA